MENYVAETLNLTKQYGDQIAVNHVNIHLPKGKIYGLIGRNGAGKTTIMKMMLGITYATEGEIRLFSEPVVKHSKMLCSRIGSFIETPCFYPNLTATENLQIIAKSRGTIHVDAIRNTLDLVELPYRDKKLLSGYSLGMKQRLGIAFALMHDPELLILDEPTNGFDPIGIAQMRELFKHLSHEKGKTILISSHILSEMALMADYIGIIHKGNLLEEATYKELERRSQKYLHLKVDSAANATRILEQYCGIIEYQVETPTDIHIFDNPCDLAMINKTLLKHEVDVQEIQIFTETLEDQFIKMTGGMRYD